MCMICKALNPHLNRGAARTAEIPDAFVRANAEAWGPSSADGPAVQGRKAVASLLQPSAV
jgi:hypothetical protein